MIREKVTNAFFTELIQELTNISSLEIKTVPNYIRDSIIYLLVRKINKTRNVIEELSISLSDEEIIGINEVIDSLKDKFGGFLSIGYKTLYFKKGD